MGRPDWSVGALSPLLIATVLAVVGCSGNDDDSAATSATIALTAHELEAALLTPAEVGSEWRSEGAKRLDVGTGDETGGRCPAGSSFPTPTAATIIDFEPPDLADNTIEEALLTFQTGEELDAWTAALKSCVGERWEESDDPVEHVSLETIDLADHGEEAAVFVFHFAHGKDEDVAHASRWFLVRVGGALLLVTGDDYELESSQDEELLADVLARAVEKAEATLHS
jgi:hypothetical protein